MRRSAPLRVKQLCKIGHFTVGCFVKSGEAVPCPCLLKWVFAQWKWAQGWCVCCTSSYDCNKWNIPQRFGFLFHPGSECYTEAHVVEMYSSCETVKQDRNNITCFSIPKPALQYKMKGFSAENMKNCTQELKRFNCKASENKQCFKAL